MSLSRRHFVQLSSLSLLAGVALPSAFAQGEETEDEAFSPEKLAVLDGLYRQNFEPYIADRLAISLDGQSLGKLTLIEVRDTTPGLAEPGPRGRSAAAAPALTGFALRFQGSGGRLPQGTYTFFQPALGTFPLFIVPTGPDADTPTYTALFTRFATSEAS